MIYLGGRWTTQLNALEEAGWINEHDFRTLDVTVHSDSCRWFVPVVYLVSGEEFRGH